VIGLKYIEDFLSNYNKWKLLHTCEYDGARRLAMRADDNTSLLITAKVGIYDLAAVFNYAFEIDNYIGEN
jgi:hypothetical protein